MQYGVEYNTMGQRDNPGTFSEDNDRGGGVFLAESIEGKSIDYKDKYQAISESPIAKVNNSHGHQ
jgi:hypothetical protein